MNTKFLQEYIQELESALSAKNSIEQEFSKFKSDHEICGENSIVLKNELDLCRTTLTEHEGQILKLNSEILNSKKSLNMFIEELCVLLSDNTLKVESNEDDIKKHIRLLMSSSMDRGIVYLDHHLNCKS